MSDKRYMNGRGVMQKTGELNDAVWKHLPAAWLGGSAAVLSMVYTAAIATSPVEILIASGLTAFGALFTIPWIRACHALHRHTKAMVDETKKRGKGWAAS